MRSIKNQLLSSGPVFYDNGSFFSLTRPIKEYVSLPVTFSKAEVAEMIARVQRKERKLIGQELHDNVNQVLSMVKLFMEMLKPGDDREESIREKGVEYVMMAINEIRKISKELVVVKQKEEKLIDSIQTIIADIQFTTQLKIQFTCTGDVESFTTETKTALLRIVQEQLKNILKHSQATRVSIQLHGEEEQLKLSIRDNGIGFNTEEKGHGIGLVNICDRVQSCNGIMQIKSAKNFGCTVSVSIPR